MKILITGGSGYLGKNLFDYLKKKKTKFKTISIPRSIDLTLEKKVNNYFMKSGKLNYIFHFAEVSGNKSWSKKNSFQQTLMNLRINVNIISAWKKYQPNAKFIFVSSVWSYPLGDPFLKEKDYWKGELNPETIHFAYNKRIATILLESAKSNFKLKATTLILGTVYGPGDLSDHFIPTIIRRMKKEKKTLQVYGTGLESRDFIYIDDQIKGIFMHKDQNEEIINIGTGKLTSIKSIIEISKKIMKYKGKIKYMKINKSMDIKRGMSVYRAKKLTGWSNNNMFMKIENGLLNTITDMEKNG
jgi:GDP-L-fucose synthase